MNIGAVAVLVGLIGLVLWISELWIKRQPAHALAARKLLHIAGVGAVAVAPIYFIEKSWLVLVLLAASVILAVAVSRQWLRVDVHARKSWGIAIFPLAAAILLLLYARLDVARVLYPMLVLTLADAAAALVGSRFSGGAVYLNGSKKSPMGSLAFLGCTLLIYMVLPGVLQGFHPYWQLSLAGERGGAVPWITVLALALVLTHTEAVSGGSWDNLSVPLMAAWLMGMLPQLAGHVVAWVIPVWAGFGGAAFLAYWRKWLSPGGAATAWLLGWVVWLAGGWASVGLLAVFFVSGSLLSRLPTVGQAVADGKQGKPRDGMQVFANGGVAMLCLMAYGIAPHPGWLFLFAVSVAVSTADTFSSEAGLRFGKKTYNLAGFGPVPAGLSGGVSVVGTLAGAAGALLIAVVANYMGIGHAAWVAVGGFAGMLLDSLLGSLWQAKYRQPAGHFADEPFLPGQGKPHKGFAWFTNDVVNLISNLITILVAAFMLYKNLPWG
jgi:uncharacterized protein (TIGR00297 family)